jgi:hypothetical protein
MRAFLSGPDPAQEKHAAPQHQSLSFLSCSSGIVIYRAPDLVRDCGSASPCTGYVVGFEGIFKLFAQVCGKTVGRCVSATCVPACFRIFPIRIRYRLLEMRIIVYTLGRRTCLLIAIYLLFPIIECVCSDPGSGCGPALRKNTETRREAAEVA